MRTRTTRALMVAGLMVCAGFATSSAPAAEFTFKTSDPSFFEARWGITDYWILSSGLDDGFAGIPDGLDTIVIDRNPNAVNGTKLTLDGSGPPTAVPLPLTVAKITGTGASGIDIQTKTFGFTVGDLELLASSQAFRIDHERDQSLTINGVISGAGDLVLSRGGSFSDGVTPDEVTLIGGTSPNTITGDIFLLNNSNGAQPSYWVADKVGAFGQTTNLTLEVNGTGGGTNVAQLVFTTNTIGGEGAIDDDVTQVNLGLNAEFNVAAGVNEFIGSGLLTVNGNVIADDVYDNTESWITGDGLITVGVPEPSSLALLGLGGLMIARRRRG